MSSDLSRRSGPLPSSSSSVQRARFGPWSFDSATLELWRDGEARSLGRQSALVLSLLLERRGELLRREEIAARLWPNEYHVDVETGINNAVRRLRRALGESARDPRFVETLPGRGYRFHPAGPGPGRFQATDGPLPRKRRRSAVAAATVCALGLALGSWLLASGSRPASELRDPADVRRYHRAVALLESVPTDRYEGPELAEHLQRALTLLNAVSARSPRFANARAQAALAHAWTGLWLPPSRWGPLARAAAEAALESDPDHAEAWTVLSAVSLQLDLDARRALVFARRAVRSSPGSATARLALARSLVALSRFEEAEEEIAIARGRDPDDLQVLRTGAFLLSTAGRHEEALSYAEGVLAARSVEPGIRLLRIRTALWREDPAGALSAANEPVDASGGDRAPFDSLEEYWRSVERYFLENGRIVSTAPWFSSVAALHLGKRGRAARILLDACRARTSGLLAFAPVDRDLRELSGEPAFAEFLDCAGAREDSSVGGGRAVLPSAPEPETRRHDPRRTERVG